MKIVFALCLATACGDPTIHPVDAHMIHGDPDAPAADAPIDAPAARSGLVSIAQDQDVTNANPSAIFAFGDVFGAPVGVDGPCTVTTNPAQRGLSAGAIAVTGTTPAVTITPTGTAPDVTYHAAPATVFTAGATLSVAAAGGPDFPAFNATVTGPTTLAGFVVPTTLSRTGYTAHWTAGTEHVWVILVATTSQATDLTYVVCKVDDTGTFTIPASTFALIPAADTKAAVGVGRVSSSDVTTAAGHVTVAAISDTTSGLINLTP